MGSQGDGQRSSSALRAALAGEGLSFGWFAIGSVPLLEIGAKAGFDAIVIDLQHGLWDRGSAHLAVSAMGETPVVMRVAANTVAAIGEALDTGAAGILVPLVDTAEEARAAVSAASFPPEGRRSGGGVRPLSEGFARYYAHYGRPLIGVMIETTDGVANAAEIAAVPGIDFVFLGTGDLALSIGCFPELDERHEAACVEVFARCRDAGMPCGIFTGSAEAARNRLGQGYAAVVAANDVDIVADGFSEAAAQVRDGPKLAANGDIA